MQPALGNALNLLVQRLESARKSHQPINMAACINLLSYSVICYLVFGVEVNEEQLQFAQQLDCLDFSVSEGLMLMYKWMPTRRNSRMGEIHHSFDRLIADLSKQSDQADGICVYSILKKTMPPEQLKNELKNYIFSGSTVTNLLVWCLYALAGNGEKSEKVYQEVRQQRDSLLSGEVLNNLKYTRCFVKEVMRLYPPVWLMSRRCTQTHQVNGFEFVKGEVFWVSPWTLHRNPQYRQDVDQFIPERFMPENASVLEYKAYIPFSVGPRMCIGRHFGMSEAIATIATLAS